MKALGRHILAEYFSCDRDILNDVVALEKFLNDAAKAANATVISSSFRTFQPFGVSGIVIIAESHLAIHTWPEYGYAAIDFFTCGDSADPWKAHEYLKNLLKPLHTKEQEVLRGVLDLEHFTYKAQCNSVVEQ
ncbi:MAG TPA: S-adenosylmethionine decarboxylase proenzyme [Desulfurella acetivorans]|uniref:S-adenosylmethionine decarboxylase proenzyme n=1 Tax=Desulfurella acetivorans TaxID=33002 RepID=A0A7C6E872_DESAE|nr:S-adenosylmethionine decarboxylase proenzyme [Desulfurella acetivorans]